MSPQQTIQRLLADIPRYEAADLATLLPQVAALLAALCARAAAFPEPPVFLEIDYLLTAEQTGQRLGKSAKWVREHISLFPFAFLLGQEHRFSARKLDQWIAENSAIQ